MLSLASPSFDIWLFEVCNPLVSGGRVRLLRKAEVIEVGRLCEALTEVTMVHGVPSLLRQVVRQVGAQGGDYGQLRRVFIGGDEVAEGLLQEVAAVFAKAEVEELYGPTEATIICTSRRVERGVAKRRAVIGKPLGNVKVRIVDEQGAAVGVGIGGEIWIGGGGVSRGYLGQAAMTAGRYVEVGGERYYRSGDLGRWNGEGEIEYLGRSDEQVKVRGYRVEVGEVESVMREAKGVREAAVVARGGAGEEKRLVGYVVMEEGREGEEVGLRRWLRERLPEWMVPEVVVGVAAMPVSSNGKLERGRLPEVSGERRALESAYEGARSAVEGYLVEVWGEVLGVGEVGIRDNFFEMGGDSIKAVLCTNKLQERLGEVVYVVALFEAPTIAELAAYLNTRYADTIKRIFKLEGPEVEEAEPARPPAEPIDERHVAAIRQLIRSPKPGESHSAKNPRAIFILSPPRSGSTLLRVMLAGHPQLFAPPELELLGFNRLDERQAAYAGKYKFWLEGATRALMEIKQCSAAEAERLMTGYEQQGMSVKQFYGLLQAGLGRRLLVEKTPSYSQDLAVLRRAEAEFDEPFYIHLLRHPLGMIRSFERAKLEQVFFIRYAHDFGARQLAELLWVVGQRNIVELLGGVSEERQCRVRFEELVKEPRRVMAGLCEKLKLEMAEGMLKPYEESERKMTDGLYPLSKMVGDVKFHEHEGIEAEVAERWAAESGEDFLGEITWQLAESLGYQKAVTTAKVYDAAATQTDLPSMNSIPVLSRGNQELDLLLAELSQLSEDEVKTILAGEMQDESGSIS